MPTKNPRIHITMNPEETALLEALADKENKSISSLAHELILDALDRREDIALSAIAQARDQKDEKTLRHEDVWK